MIFWLLLKSPSDPWLHFPTALLRALDIFHISKEASLLFLPRCKEFCVNWCCKQIACIYKLSKCFLDKDSYCSLKQVHLFGWREYFVKERQADIYLLMSLKLCDKIWQSNYECNNLSQFYGILSHTEFMPLFKLPKVFKFSKRFLGQNSHKISAIIFKAFSSSLYTWDNFPVLNILPKRICLFRNILEIRLESSKKSCRTYIYTGYFLIKMLIKLCDEHLLYMYLKGSMSMRMWPLTVF